VGCSAGYVTWFTSDFAVNDRSVLGTADFPSMPWVGPGTLSIRNGRMTGNGTARASQGLAFLYPGVRLRFKGSFSDSSQHLIVALNGKPDGSEGIRIDVSAGGALVVTEGTTKRAEQSFSVFTVNEDWFAEATFSDTDAVVVLSKGNYVSAGGSAVLANLRATALARSAIGSRLAVTLSSPGSLSPTLDEVSVGRCGVPVAAYHVIFRDAFERPNSSTPGNADVPPTSTWVPSDSSIVITDRALTFNGAGSSLTAPQGQYVANQGVRLRYVLHAPVVPTQFVHFVSYDFGGSVSPSFGIAWRDASTTAIAIGGPEQLHPFSLAAGSTYYVEFDVDGLDGVLSLRTGSFTGPVVALQASSDIPGAPASNQDLFLSGGRGLQIQEVELAQYTP